MSNLNLKIDKSKCIQCGKCIKDCICSVLEFGDEKIPKIANGGENRCIKCQHCFAVCPTGALSILGKKPENSPSVLQEPNSEEVLKLIQTRKSIRKFKTENLSKDKFNKLKEMLPWIPTGCNDHRLLFTFIDDIDAMARFKNKTYKLMKEMYEKAEQTEEEKKLLAFKNPVLNGDDIVFRNAPHLAVVCSPKDAPCADVDPIIALSYIELYAQSMGIATVWCGIATYCLEAFPELVKELKIPNDYKPVYCMLLGVPDIKYKRITQPEKYKIITYGKTLAKIEAFYNKIKKTFIEFMK